MWKHDCANKNLLCLINKLDKVLLMFILCNLSLIFYLLVKTLYWSYNCSQWLKILRYQRTSYLSPTKWGTHTYAELRHLHFPSEQECLSVKLTDRCHTRYLTWQHALSLVVLCHSCWQVTRYFRVEDIYKHSAIVKHLLRPNMTSLKSLFSSLLLHLHRNSYFSFDMMQLWFLCAG